VDFVKKFHKKWHFDSYRIDLNFHSEQVLNIRKSHADDVVKNRKKCFWLWNTFMVLWDGTVYPCCNWNFEEDIFKLGNVYDKNIREIWNSEPYTKLRYNFTREDYGKELPDFCKDCMGIPKN
jgi:radical SAM protein with 4Fe4S-binding SPASM domain